MDTARAVVAAAEADVTSWLEAVGGGDDFPYQASVEYTIENDIPRTPILTYGEITVRGIARALDVALRLRRQSEYQLDTPTFYDIGSGRGVATLAAARLADGGQGGNGRFVRCVGVELLPPLHDCACRAAALRKERGRSRKPRARCAVDFVQQDLFTPGAAWTQEASIVYVAATRMDDFLPELAAKLPVKLATS